MLAGAPGFEPGNDGTKNRCLTAWLRPNASTLRCERPYNSVFEKHNRVEWILCSFRLPRSSSMPLWENRNAPNAIGMAVAAMREGATPNCRFPSTAAGQEGADSSYGI